MAGRDPQPYALDSLQDLLRTDVGAWSARGPLTLGAEAALMQDLRTDPVSIDRRLFGPEGRATFQRLPGVFAQLAPVPMGPATLGGEASVVQFERYSKAGAEEQATGFGPTDRGAGATQACPLVTGAAVLGSLLAQCPAGDPSRAPALRFDLAPRLRFAGPATLPLDLRAEAGGRVDAWVMEGSSDRDRARAYALIGASAGLPFERRFGDLLHRVEPELAVRALSRPLQAGGPPVGDSTDAGGATFSSSPDAAQQGLAPGIACASCADGTTLGVPAARRGYDEIDFAAPVSGAVEATASLSQSLWRKVGNGAARIFGLNLLQDALVWAHGAKARLGETSADAFALLGPLSVSAGMRYDWKLRDLVVFGAGAGMRDARTDEVHASMNLLRGSSSARLRAGIDELFSAARYDVAAGSLSGSAAWGASAVFSNFRLAYNTAWTPGDTPPAFANFLHTLSLTYETPCHCAGFLVALGFPFHDTQLIGDRPSFSFKLDLKSLGSFSTF